jgi:hypothetical protein
MAETKAELQQTVQELTRQAINDRVSKLEAYKDKIEPKMYFVNAVSWVLMTGGLGFFAAIVYGAFWLGELNNEVKNHKDWLAKLEKSVDELKRRPMSFMYREGIVVRVKNDEITIRFDPDDKQPDQTYRLVPDGRVMVRGKRGTLADLKPGDRVRVGIDRPEPLDGVADALWVETVMKDMPKDK